MKYIYHHLLNVLVALVVISNFLSFDIIPISNALNTIFLPLRSGIALLITSSFILFMLEFFCGFLIVLNFLIYFGKWFCSSFSIYILVILLLSSLPKTHIVLNVLKLKGFLYPFYTILILSVFFFFFSSFHFVDNFRI